jgi:hypothetical protein
VAVEKDEPEEFCIKHPTKKAKFFCEKDNQNICSKCIVIDHKGHNISDREEEGKQQGFVKKAQILLKKIDASMNETVMFEDELNEISEQLEGQKEASIKDLEEKLDLLIELLKTRMDSLTQSVEQHYRK